MITALRHGNRTRFRGPWIPGELISRPLPWPALTDLTDLTACGCEPETCRPVVLGPDTVAAVHDIDWAARTGRIEIALGPASDPQQAVDEIVRYTFRDLNLTKIWGWVTPDGPHGYSGLADNGFVCEARVPHGHWMGGGFHDREIWARGGDHDER